MRPSDPWLADLNVFDGGQLPYAQAVSAFGPLLRASCYIRSRIGSSDYAILGDGVFPVYETPALGHQHRLSWMRSEGAKFVGLMDNWDEDMPLLRLSDTEPSELFDAVEREWSGVLDDPISVGLVMTPKFGMEVGSGDCLVVFTRETATSMLRR